MKTLIPPIKSQGIKTKLVPFLNDILPQKFNGTWIEPFMGTGVVGFNLSINKAIFADSNPHLINFYNSLKLKKISATIIKDFLQEEGSKLLSNGEEYYYYIRDRFNTNGDTLDFLFLNRACFNGMIRFNRKGGFNVPFCRKPQRFAQAYITKIVNQVINFENILKYKDFTFICQSYKDTLKNTSVNDLIYCDPPYIDRHSDYFNSWTEDDEHALFELLNNTKCNFILSTWHSNSFRENIYIKQLWNKFNIINKNHFYHIGGKEENRNPVVEALVTNFITTKPFKSITETNADLLTPQLFI